MPFDPSKFRARLASERKWYKITNLTGGEADVLLYGEIGWLGTTAEEFVTEIKQLQASQISLHLSSPGGSVFDGIAIMNALRAHPANVTVYVDSLAASIASVIAMAGDRIVARQASEFMIHEAAGLVVGNAADCRELADLLDRQSDKIAGIYAARAGGSVEDWRAAMAKETWYSAEEAVAAGLADEVDDAPRKTQSAPGEMAVAASWDLSVFRYAGREKAPAPEPVAKAEPPKPAPPVQAPEPQTTEVRLTFNVGDSLDEELLALLRKSVAKRGEPSSTVHAEPEGAATPAGAPVPDVLDTASPVHHTATEDRPWDASPNEKRLPSPMTVKTAKAMYAWYDPDQADENGELPKSACKLPHHEVSADGTPGAANLSGVRNALARLPQSDIPASQHDAVRRHLQAHLDDAKSAENTTEVQLAAELQGEHGAELLPLETDAATTEAEPEPSVAVEEPTDDTEGAAPGAAEADPADTTWAAAVGRLTQPQSDSWAAAVARFTHSTSASSAATNAA